MFESHQQLELNHERREKSSFSKKYILKDSYYCFDSLAIRLRSKDLKTSYPKNRTTRITGLACMKKGLTVRNGHM